MLDEQDIKVLKKMKSMRGKSKRSFSSVINNKNLTEEELDELFLSS